MSQARIGVYPGTFDPVTFGHLDIIRRATRIVDHLIVGIAVNDGKGPLFTLEQRAEMVREDIAALEINGAKVDVRPFSGLLVQFAEDAGASLIVRGLRAVSDFEYEFQMAGMNARLNPGIETVFLMASERHHFISSRFVKEICRLGGDVSPFVTGAVQARLREALDPEG